MTSQPSITPNDQRRVVVVPDVLLDDGTTRARSVTVAVLGAGLAGLATAIELVESGFTGSVLLVDRRRQYRADRTWSFWHVAHTPFDHLIDARWERWKVVSASGEHIAGSTETPYVSIAAEDVYQDAFTRLARHPNVRVLLDTAVTRFDTHAIDSGRGLIEAEHVIDARGADPELHAAAARRGTTFIPQHFLGQRIRADRPVFDPGVATLMDFTVDQCAGLRFMYLLPTSTTEALVESTYFSNTPVTPVQYRAEILDYLVRAHGLLPGEVAVLSEERGWIPMTQQRSRPSAASISVGARGGAIRPSTGYAFLRSLRSARAAGHAVIAGTPIQSLDDTRRRFLDMVFLRFLQDRPELAPELFARMFAKTPHPALIRFLSDQSTVPDELRLILALPKRPMLAAAASACLARARLIRRPITPGVQHVR